MNFINFDIRYICIFTLAIYRMKMNFQCVQLQEILYNIVDFINYCSEIQ